MVFLLVLLAEEVPIRKNRGSYVRKSDLHRVLTKNLSDLVTCWVVPRLTCLLLPLTEFLTNTRGTGVR